MARMNRFAAALSMGAALSMIATPAAAAELPVSTGRTTVATPGVFEADGENVERHRYYRYRHRRHRHGVDAGDVLAGVLIIGGIAAIASAASKNKRDRDYRNRDYRYRDYRYRDRDYRDRDYDYRERRGDSRYDGGRGIDRAVNMCVSRIERDVRVDSVDSVDRTGEGWRVTGSLYNGERFTCRIGSDGRVEDIDYGGLAAGDFSEDRQHNDERYEAAWEQARNSQEQASAYPGGPVDGDLATEDAGDDRYRTAEAPDFTG